MRRLKSVVILVSFLFAISTACVSEGKSEDRMETISGTLSMKGSEPHTYLALTTEDGTEYRITGPLMEELSVNFQYKKIELSGTVTRAALGPGAPAEFLASDYKLR